MPMFSKKHKLEKISMAVHHDNMSMTCRSPYTPLLYSETWVYRGIHYFLIFALNIDCGYSLEPPQ